MYRIIIEGFQKEFETKDQACKFAATMMGIDLFYINVDETKKPKGVKVPTVFIKDQIFDHDSIIMASNHLSAMAVSFSNNKINPAIKLITIKN